VVENFSFNMVIIVNFYIK